MIKYDYTLKRDEEDEKNTYTPQFSKELGNLVEIQAPNSSGKSTILNAIALAFYGYDNENIDQELRSEIRNLVEMPHQNIEFEIELEDEDCKIVSKKDLDSKRPEVRDLSGEHDRPLTKDEFRDRFSLIYDIPNNPLNRIKELSDKAEEELFAIETRLQEFRTHVNNVVEEIDEQLDPEELENCKEEREQLKEKHKEIRSEANELKEKVRLKKKFTYTRFVDEYRKDLEEVKKEIDKLEDQGADKEDLSTLMENFNKELEELRELHDEASSLVLEIFEDNAISGFTSLSLDPGKESDYKFDPDTDETLSSLKEKVKKEINEIEQSEEYIEYEFYNELVSTLRKYKDKDIDLPISESLQDFAQGILDEMKEKEEVYNRKSELNSLETNLESIEDEIQEIREKYAEKLRRRNNDQDVAGEESRRKLEQLRKKKTDYENNLDEFMQKYAEVGSPEMEELRKKDDEDKISIWWEQEEGKLTNDIEEKEHQLNELEERKENLRQNIVELDNLIEKMGEKEPHEHKDHEQDLIKLSEMVTDVLNEIKAYRDYTGSIEDKNKIESEEEQKYYDALFSYLGDRMGVVKHDDSEFTVEKVNLIEGKTITEKGKIIHFSDFGTGQSQSAYLKSVLNTSDDRKVIALIDEVAMMDSESLDQVYDKLREMKDEGKLLLGIVVRKSKEKKVKTI